MAVGAGAGARGHSGGQWPGLDLNVSQPAGLASVILPLDGTSRTSLDYAEDERGWARRLSQVRGGRTRAA